MRFWIVLCLILLLPGLYLGCNDYIKSTRTPEKPFAFSTIAEVWLDHDRAGFMEFRGTYIGKPAEWDQNVLPYLSMKAAPLATIPLIILLVLALCAWLLGIGPFNNLSPGSHHGARRETGRIGRVRPSEHQNRVNYRRK